MSKKNEQLHIAWSTEAEDRDCHYDVLDNVRTCVAMIGHKTVAYDLRVRESDLSNMLAERDRHRLKLEMLPYFLRNAPNHNIIERLASVRNLTVSAPRPLSAGERLEKLDRALRETLSSDLRELIYKKAEHINSWHSH